MRLVLNKTWEVESNEVEGIYYREFLEHLFKADLEEFLDKLGMSYLDYEMLSELLSHKVLQKRSYRTFYINDYCVMVFEEYVLIYNANGYLFLETAKLNVGVCTPMSMQSIQDNCSVVYTDKNMVEFHYNRYIVAFSINDYCRMIEKVLQ